MDKFSLNFAYRQPQIAVNSFLVIYTTYGEMPVQYVPCSEKLVLLSDCNEWQYTFCVQQQDIPAGLDVCNITPDLIIPPYMTPNNSLNLQSSESNTINGSGSEASPYTVDLNVDPTADNLIEVTAAGVKVILPDDGFTFLDRIKLDGIEDDATRDQTAAEIKVLYESNANTNAFTDSQVTKLNGIEAGATEDQTGAEMVIAIDAEPDATIMTDVMVDKLANIEEFADVTDTLNVGSAVDSATEKNNIVNGDFIAVSDSEAAGILVKTSLAALKSALNVNHISSLLSSTLPDGTPGGASLVGWNPRNINTKDYDPLNSVSIERMAFIDGGVYEIQALDVITGDIAGATAQVHSVQLFSGSWANGDAAGFLWLNNIVGTFQSAETLSVGININIATTDGIIINDHEVRILTGEYQVTALPTSNEVGNTITSIYSVTDAAYLIQGQNNFSGTVNNATHASPVCIGIINVAQPTTIAVHHYCSIAVAIDGLGLPNGVAGFEEIYTTLSISGV